MMLVQRTQRGVAAVELGLLLVPLVTLVFGVTEFGRAMYEYNAITKAARVGARHLSQFKAGDTDNAIVARNLVVCGYSSCSGKTPIVPGLTTGMVTVSDASNTASLKFQPITMGGAAVGVTNLVRVTVAGYKFNSLLSFITPDITFDPISVTMVQAIP